MARAVMLLLLMLVSELPDGVQSAPAKDDYMTVYACEGQTLRLECSHHELIQLIRANFGRFSITICNDQGNTDWSVNCMSPRTLYALQKSCGRSRTCSVDVNSFRFGEPCDGTYKYIEVQYKCVKEGATETTRPPLPPWYAPYFDTSQLNLPYQVDSSSWPVTPNADTGDFFEQIESLRTHSEDTGSRVNVTEDANQQRITKWRHQSRFDVRDRSQLATHDALPSSRNVVTDGAPLMRPQSDPQTIPLPRLDKSNSPQSDFSVDKNSDDKNDIEVIPEVISTKSQPEINSASRVLGGESGESTATTMTDTALTESSHSNYIDKNIKNPLPDLLPVGTSGSGESRDLHQIPRTSNQQPELSEKTVQILPEAPGCRPEVVNGIQWGPGTVGDRVHAACPAGTSGQAFRQCDKTGVWLSNPDLSGCKSHRLQLVLAATAGDVSQPLSVQQLLHTAAQLVEVLRLTQQPTAARIYGGDVRMIARALEKFAQSVKNPQNTNDNSISHHAQGYVLEFGGIKDRLQRATLVEQLLSSSILATSGLLEAAAAWHDLAAVPRKRDNLANSLLAAAEMIAGRLAAEILHDKTVVEVTSNIMMSIHHRKLPPSSTSGEFEVSPEVAPAAVWNDRVTVHVGDTTSAHSTSGRSTSGRYLRLVLTSLTSNIAELGIFQLLPSGYRLDSRILSIHNVNENSHQMSLSAHYTIVHGQDIEQMRGEGEQVVMRRVCGIWRTDTHQWSVDSGVCEAMTSSNVTHTHCNCRGAHNYRVAVLAVIGSVRPIQHPTITPGSDGMHFGVAIPTMWRSNGLPVYVSGAIATICLAAVVLQQLLHLLLKMPDAPNAANSFSGRIACRVATVLRLNLAATLLAVELTTLTNIQQQHQLRNSTSSTVLTPSQCRALAAVTQVALLSLATWLLLHVHRLYALANEGAEGGNRGLFPWRRSSVSQANTSLTSPSVVFTMLACGYGGPLVTVAVGWLIQWNIGDSNSVSDSDGDRCWRFMYDWAVFWSFVVPALLLILVTFLLLLIGVVILRRQRHLYKTVTDWQGVSIVRHLRIAAILCVLVIGTWFCGLLYLRWDSHVLCVLFALLNTAMAVFFVAEKCWLGIQFDGTSLLGHCLSSSAMTDQSSENSSVKSTKTITTSVKIDEMVKSFWPAKVCCDPNNAAGNVEITSHMAGDQRLVSRLGQYPPSATLPDLHMTSTLPVRGHVTTLLRRQGTTDTIGTHTVTLKPKSIHRSGHKLVGHIGPVRSAILMPPAKSTTHSCYKLPKSGAVCTGNSAAISEPVYEEIADTTIDFQQQQQYQQLYSRLTLPETATGTPTASIAPSSGETVSYRSAVLDSAAMPPLSEAYLRHFDAAQAYADLRQLRRQLSSKNTPTASATTAALLLQHVKLSAEENSWPQSCSDFNHTLSNT